MTQTEQLQGFLDTADGQRQYLEWATNPFTLLLLGAVEEGFGKPRGLVPDGAVALQEVGRLVGVSEVTGFLRSPRSGASEAMKRLAALRPTYGSDKLIKEA